MNHLQFKVLSGREARAYTQALAQLRIKIFRDYPYLYEGSLEYEREYLEVYFSSQESSAILCFDGDQLVGASTVIPLRDEMPSIKKPFLDQGHNLDDYVYFGESILEPHYRGQGIGKKFFELRKECASHIRDACWAVFCAVIRQEDKYPRPTNYSPLNDFWKKQGFEEWTGMKCSLSWKCLGEAKESTHELQFWKHKLEG